LPQRFGELAYAVGYATSFQPERGVWRLPTHTGFLVQLSSGVSLSTFEFDDSSFAGLDSPTTAALETSDILPVSAARAAAPAEPSAKAPPEANTGRMSPVPGQIYTVMARQGVNAAEVVNAALKTKTVGDKTPRRVEVIAPHGPSTSGGKKARQSITLAPVSGQGAAVVFGFLDVADKSVEFRPYATVAKQHRARFGEDFEVRPDEYEAVRRDVAQLLGNLGFQPLEDEDEEDDDDDGRVDRRKLALIGLGVFITTVLAVWWLK
jgi:hypothetical protein